MNNLYTFKEFLNENEKFKKSKSGWYLVTTQGYYDRSWTDLNGGKFITRNPEKFTDNEDDISKNRYEIMPIEIK